MGHTPDQRKIEFKFKRPEYDASQAAKTALEIGALASRLAQEKRTRVENPDGRPENVAEHSFMLAKVARELAVLLYPHLDPNLVVTYALIHDDIEAYVGDTTTDIITEEELEQKYARERLGAAKLKQEYAHMPSYVKLIEDYEAQKVAEARFVRIVDKIMPIVVHFQDNGKVVKRNISKEALLDPQRRETKAAKLRENYPEFEEVIALREELVALMAETFLRSNKTKRINLKTLSTIFRRKSWR